MSLPEGDFVEAFLRANPAWLAEHPELYRVLERRCGCMARVRPTTWRRCFGCSGSARTDCLPRVERLQAWRAGCRMRTALLRPLYRRLRQRRDACILAVDAACLCMEAEHPGARRLPDETVARLLDGRQVVFREAPADARLLHAEAAALARHDALVRVPGEGPPALVALLARDQHMLDPAQGTGSSSGSLAGQSRPH